MQGSPDVTINVIAQAKSNQVIPLDEEYNPEMISIARLEYFSPFPIIAFKFMFMWVIFKE